VKAAVTDLRPYFFLSYTHTPERPWVEKLFQDIRLEVLERTTLPVSSPVGFMDTDTVPLGGVWREEVARALATCSVFVPLFSPRYFTSEECGVEWHAFAQRILDHQLLHPGKAPLIVPALWTPVNPHDLPGVAQRIQLYHADLGVEYTKEGFYTLIKNSLYRHEYVTAIQRLAVHIIQAVETCRLRPCDVRDLGPRRNAFDMPGRRAPADRRLNVIVVASTEAAVPPGRNAKFYGRTANDWNPFHPATHQVIADYAAGVARLNCYEPTVLGVDEGMDLLMRQDPAAGLGLLLVDAWSALDSHLAASLRQLDAAAGWVATMVPWNLDDPQTRARSSELRGRLTELLPHRLGAARPFSTVNVSGVATLEEFRTRLPEVLDGALNGYLNHADAHPPSGTIPARPRLSNPREGAPGAEREAGERDEG
jgi:FxsC-like protein